MYIICEVLSLSRSKYYKSKLRNKNVKNKIDIGEMTNYIALLTVLIVVIVLIFNRWYNPVTYKIDDRDALAFAVPNDYRTQIKQIAIENNEDYALMLTKYCYVNKFFGDSLDVSITPEEYIEKWDSKLYNKRDIKKYYKYIKAVTDDIKTYPTIVSQEKYIIVNSYNKYDESKQYTEIVNKNNENMDIVSCTDGVVEFCGYDKNDGYTIVIKTELYMYYYSNLKKISDVKIGDTVKYGNKIGVSDKMYMRIKINEENNKWVNPYYLIQL